MKKYPDEIIPFNHDGLEKYNKIIFNSGIYVISYEHRVNYKKKICIYVGKSIRMYYRALRAKIIRYDIGNMILKSIMQNVDHNRLWIEFYHYPKHRLTSIENSYIKKLKPITQLF